PAGALGPRVGAAWRAPGDPGRAVPWARPRAPAYPAGASPPGLAGGNPAVHYPRRGGDAELCARAGGGGGAACGRRPAGHPRRVSGDRLPGPVGRGDGGARGAVVASALAPAVARGWPRVRGGWTCPSLERPPPPRRRLAHGRARDPRLAGVTAG